MKAGSVAMEGACGARVYHVIVEPGRMIGASGGSQQGTSSSSTAGEPDSIGHSVATLLEMAIESMDDRMSDSGLEIMEALTPDVCRCVGVCA